MASDVEAIVKAGIAALKGGNKEEARRNLMKAVEVAPYHEKAWLWLSGAVEGDEDRVTCLQNVLSINPENKAAQEGLKRLGVSLPVQPSQAPPPPEPQETPQPAPPAPEAQATSQPAPPAPEAEDHGIASSVEWDVPSVEASSSSPQRKVNEPTKEDLDNWVNTLNLPKTEEKQLTPEEVDELFAAKPPFEGEFDFEEADPDAAKKSKMDMIDSLFSGGAETSEEQPSIDAFGSDEPNLDAFGTQDPASDLFSDEKTGFADFDDPGLDAFGTQDPASDLFSDEKTGFADFDDPGLDAFGTQDPTSDFFDDDKMDFTESGEFANEPSFEDQLGFGGVDSNPVFTDGPFSSEFEGLDDDVDDLFDDEPQPQSAPVSPGREGAEDLFDDLGDPLSDDLLSDDLFADDNFSSGSGDFFESTFDEDYGDGDVSTTELFSAIPDTINPTRLPGTTERHPLPIVIGLVLLIILNVGAAALLVFQLTQL